jgi:multicomponent K+:H+ antiporter subunit C
MELALALAVGALFAGGTWLVLRRELYAVLLGTILLSYGVNLLLLASGRLTRGSAPLVRAARDGLPDPLPQALVLTAIVIGFAVSALLVALALGLAHGDGDDRIDADDDGERP